ncbi:hypothetical protein [Sandarakinorhabdus rubra]|uniref:hypothetical protein n=1 Tax=Sandarakinorhabdus rubra TaxID=2672568 RepID=UPI0013DACFCF|nr:hypothetical protein [Sandarakinorhabdus rubra]
MRATSEFLETQILSCARMAADAGLSNQRAMFLRAQAAWQALADKESVVQAERIKRTPA